MLIPNGDVTCIVYYEVVLISTEKLICRQTNQEPEPQEPGFGWPLQKALPEKITGAEN